MTPAQSEAARLVLDEVMRERQRQHARWGEQSHPDGTGIVETVELLFDILHGSELDPSAEARHLVDQAAGDGRSTWAPILMEEALEAMEETDPAKLRAELVQLAAVAVQWVEAIDRREA